MSSRQIKDTAIRNAIQDIERRLDRIESVGQIGARTNNSSGITFDTIDSALGSLPDVENIIRGINKITGKEKRNV